MKAPAFIRRYHRLIGYALLIVLIPLAVITVRDTFLIAQFDADKPLSSAVLLDKDGGVIATLGQRAEVFVPFEEVPWHVVNAVVAIEDARFWQHPGVDILGIARAIWVNLREGRRAQGASTITQQLARNLFLTPEKTFPRKIQEAVYALLLELRYSKPQILGLYLNQVYFGEGAYGIENAARTYFGKSSTRLTLAEGALLAGILRAPSRYTPYQNPEGAKERRNVVLARMEELQLIDSVERQRAAAEEIVLAEQRTGRAPYFVDYVRAWLGERFDAATLFGQGLRVHTSLDPTLQRIAEEVLGEHQGAIVVLDATSGAIRAMVGGRDYRESQFNRAVHAVRQPGSAFKPFVFAAALERGWQMNDLVEDIPRDYGGYAPRNFRDEYWGPVTMKQALVRSLNNGSVWLLREIGVSAALEMARRLGITTLTADDRHLGIALGGLTHGATPLEMAAAYLPFASGGIGHAPHAILEVRDESGRVYYRHREAPRRLLSEEVAYFITEMLQDAVRRGTGSAANIGRPQAGKTGTSDDQRNAWFVGYTPELVASVYIGNDDGSPVTGGGGTLAAPIWGRLMSRALMDAPVTAFSVPDYVVTGVTIDIMTGLLADESCPHREIDSFVIGRVPTNYSPCTRRTPESPGFGTPFFPGQIPAEPELRPDSDDPRPLPAPIPEREAQEPPSFWERRLFSTPPVSLGPSGSSGDQEPVLEPAFD